MNNLREQPPWKRFNPNVVTLPTSRTCTRKEPGCKVAKAHALLNDAESYLREALNEMEPNSDQEMEDLGQLKGLADVLMRAELRMRDVLLRNGTTCPDAERCRGL